jgi:hypothetical protein
LMPLMGLSKIVPLSNIPGNTMSTFGPQMFLQETMNFTAAFATFVTALATFLKKVAPSLAFSPALPRMASLAPRSSVRLSPISAGCVVSSSAGWCRSMFGLPRLDP